MFSMNYCLILYACLICLIDGGLPPEEGVCKSDADCATEECCVGIDRKRFIFSHPTSGICRPLRYQGHACHVFATLDPSNHNLHVNYCPCSDGLECRGTSVDKLNSSNIIHHDPKCLPKQL
ncbi:prokineticin Bm8-f-like [Ruditapes philippinarum]|uniref:prokineticin Bm8-f-like n=1 Tax=Ruditapes philippinarum TaxID=129788 RepID=UPI00295C0F53|nr:prokineticin Bm8-f-like [Ruditapes philippinarum]